MTVTVGVGLGFAGLGGRTVSRGSCAGRLDDDADDVQLGEADEGLDLDGPGQVAGGRLDLDDLADRHARHERLVACWSRR